MPSTSWNDYPRPERRAIATPFAQIRREPVEWLDPGRVPIGLVTVLAGIGGLGKSQWTDLLAARLSRGEFGEFGVSLLATAEDSESSTVRPRLEAAGARIELVHSITIQADDGIEDGISIPGDLDEVEALVAELRARLLVVDPLVAHLPSEIDSHKDQSVRRALAPLYRLAQAQSCAVVAALHLNKATGMAPLLRLGGSGAFGNAARSVLLLDRDPDDPDGEEGNQRVLAHIKCNVARLAPSLLYQVAPILLPATSSEPEIETSRLELLGESPHNGRSLLAGFSPEERDAAAEAEEFLTSELGDGARHSAGDVIRSARQIGISEPTLRRARKRLGVETAKAGFGSGWEWWLPKASSGLTPSKTPSLDAFGETAQPGGIPAEDAPEGVRHETVTPSGTLTPSQQALNGSSEHDQAEQIGLDLGTAPLAEIHKAHEEGRL